MALEELKARLALLLDSIEEHPEDLHELHQTIRQHLAQARAMGTPLPEDLVELERKLEAGFKTGE